MKYCLNFSIYIPHMSTPNFIEIKVSSDLMGSPSLENQKMILKKAWYGDRLQSILLRGIALWPIQKQNIILTWADNWKKVVMCTHTNDEENIPLNYAFWNVSDLFEQENHSYYTMPSLNLRPALLLYDKDQMVSSTDAIDPEYQYKATKNLTSSLLAVLILDTKYREYELNRLKDRSNIYRDQEWLD